MFAPSLSPSPVTSPLHEFLQECAERSAEDGLPAHILRGQGYHTTMPNGARVRATRDAMDYALALLEEGGPASLARALRIIPRVLEVQDREPCNRTFGLWPWFFEEPVEAMRPADWNWADFIGVRLAHALGRHGERLPPGLRGGVEQALGFAAFSIFRRNMGPDYTNIAVKGGVVAVMAGEQLGQPLLLGYGRQRLARFLEHTRRNGGFTEYNSPPYGALVLVEVERGLLIVKDPDARESLRAIHELFWRLTAASLHLPTGQLCGPHARAYDDLLSDTQASLLGEELGFALFRPEGRAAPHEGGRDRINLLLVPRVACPAEIREQILSAGARRFVCQDYVRSEDPETRRRGSHWFDGDACLGSVNVENLWQQRRPLLGYWRAGEAVAMLRVRLTHGGKDFASGVLRVAQEGPAALAACSLAINKADSHDHMDVPADGVFRFDDLALGVELNAPDARVSGSPAGGFLLSAGDRRVCVKPMHAEFGPYPVEWRAAEAAGKAAVRAVINGGRAVELKPSAMRNVAICFYLRMLAPDEAPAAVDLSVTAGDDTVALRAASAGGEALALLSPRHPVALR